MTWYFYNTPQEFTEDDIGDAFGFVYVITHTKTGRKYIGKKLFTKAKTRQVKGKKKRSRVSSDWQSYYGSNKKLQEEIATNGPDEYTREIMHLCKTRSECSYWESFEIFCNHALLHEHYYNDWISCRIRKDHLIKRSTNTYVNEEQKK